MRQETIIAHAADPMLPVPYRVIRVRREMQDTYSLEVGPEGGQLSPSFAPGQFNMIYAFGVGEVPISLSGDPSQRGSLVHTVRAVGAVTSAICRLKKGDVLGLRGPFGSHWPVEESKGNDIIIVAGGIGLAPLRPALYMLSAHRDRFGKVTLLYGTRTPRDILYERELERWRGAGIDVQVTVDRATESWQGNVGVVTKLIPKIAFDRLNTVALVCGPEVMMRFTIMELEGAGIDRSSIFISMERNMKCAIGFCGHCQFGPTFVCKDGPVFQYTRLSPIFGKKEV